MRGTRTRHDRLPTVEDWFFGEFDQVAASIALFSACTLSASPGGPPPPGPRPLLAPSGHLRGAPWDARPGDAMPLEPHPWALGMGTACDGTAHPLLRLPNLEPADVFREAEIHKRRRQANDGWERQPGVPAGGGSSDVSLPSRLPVAQGGPSTLRGRAATQAPCPRVVRCADRRFGLDWKKALSR